MGFQISFPNVFMLPVSAPTEHRTLILLLFGFGIAKYESSFTANCLCYRVSYFIIW